MTDRFITYSIALGVSFTSLGVDETLFVNINSDTHESFQYRLKCRVEGLCVSLFIIEYCRNPICMDVR